MDTRDELAVYRQVVRRLAGGIVTNCWSCDGEITGPRRVVGPSAELVMCERCILEPHVETGQVLKDVACVFCGSELGKQRGWFGRRPPLRIGIQRRDQVTCDACLQLMRDIAAEWDEVDWDDHGAV